MHLFVPVLFSGLLLVVALQCPVVTFVQAPRLEFRDPELVTFFQCVVQRLDGPLQNRSEGVVEFNPVFLDGLPSRLGLGDPFFAQVNVNPTSKLVGQVPFTLPVTN